jgi:hypothetical protein
MGGSRDLDEDPRLVIDDTPEYKIPLYKRVLKPLYKIGIINQYTVLWLTSVVCFLGTYFVLMSGVKLINRILGIE